MFSPGSLPNSPSPARYRLVGCASGLPSGGARGWARSGRNRRNSQGLYRSAIPRPRRRQTDHRPDLRAAPPSSLCWMCARPACRSGLRTTPRTEYGPLPSHRVRRGAAETPWRPSIPIVAYTHHPLRRRSSVMRTSQVVPSADHHLPTGVKSGIPMCPLKTRMIPKLGSGSSRVNARVTDPMALVEFTIPFPPRLRHGDTA